MEREKLASRLGFILLSAGCAIGVGNVWKFPYMVGNNGGGAFVLIYLVFLIAFGLPIMTMEFAVGRASQKSAVKSFQQLEKPGHKWHWHGAAALCGNYLLMMFYTTVSGWMLNYFALTASGRFEGLSSTEVSAVFSEMTADPVTMSFWMIIVVLFGFIVCSLGLKNGLERVTKVMMIALLIIMVVLAVNSCFTDGASEGLKFYLIPDLSNMQERGAFNVIADAMNQSFFTLSLGIGSMAIFGSYIGKERSLMGESLNIALLDTFVAFTSGLIIFPACFTFGVSPDSGPSLIFETLPNIFNNMPLGRLWGSLFFIFLSFAALSTVLALFENIIACWIDLTGWSRKKIAYINIPLMILLSLPCVLGFNLLSGFTPLGAGSTVMDLEDFIVSNIMLPLGSLVYVLFCTRRYGWGWNSFKAEANEGRGLKVKDWMRIYVSYVIPLIVLAVFVWGIADKFFV